MKTYRGSLAAVSVLLLCTACASTPEQSSEYREQKYYRAGNNIPVKDYGAEHIQVSSPDIIHPINRPMGSAISKKPGG